MILADEWYRDMRLGKPRASGDDPKTGNGTKRDAQ